MRRLLFISALCATAVTAALPVTADAKKKRYTPKYRVTVSGVVDQSYRVDHRLSETYCNGEVRGSGRSVIRFATPQPKKVAFGIDSGFRPTLPVDVTVARSGSLWKRYCDDGTLKGGADCRTMSFPSKLKLTYPVKVKPQLLRSPDELYGWNDCPREFGLVETSIPNIGPSASRVRRLLYTCNTNAPCKHKRTNVLRVNERIVKPFATDEYVNQPYGERVTQVSWEIKFVWLNPYPGALSGR